MNLDTLALRKASPNSSASPLVFLHVPKTAGTTLWLILRRQYSPSHVLRADSGADLAAASGPLLTEARVLLGHLPYGVHRFQQQPTYVTLLREPLERTLSQYSHLVRSSNVSTLSLGEYLNAGFLENDNLQTRMLAGPEAAALSFGQCDRDVFEAAKHRLTDHSLAVAGLTERFDETLLLLQRRFAWQMPCYVPENIGPNRIRREDIPGPLLKQIWEMTRWDRALYALAAARLEAQIARQGPAFTDDLRRFRIANIRYRRMKMLAAARPISVIKSRLALDRQMALETAVRSFLSVTSGLRTHAPRPRHTFLSDTDARAPSLGPVPFS